MNKNPLSKKIISPEEFTRLSRSDHTVVFTNGCFDLLHPGHVDYLQRARALGTCLIVGLNSDTSMQRIKGPLRPITDQQSRALVLAGLASVDYIIVFVEDTPHSLITAIQPDILVKGGDWPVDQIVGRDVVQARGGQVLSLPVLTGYSTTGIIERIVQLYSSAE